MWVTEVTPQELRFVSMFCEDYNFLLSLPASARMGQSQTFENCPDSPRFEFPLLRAIEAESLQDQT
jgi:hypothetical protein